MKPRAGKCSQRMGLVCGRRTGGAGGLSASEVGEDMDVNRQDGGRCPYRGPGRVAQVVLNLGA